MATMIPPEIVIQAVDLDLQQRIQLAYQKDVQLQELYLKGTCNGKPPGGGMMNEEGLLFVGGKLWIPNSLVIKQEIC